MSEEKKKKKKKKAIIAGIIGSVALIGGGIGGTFAAILETEAKNEEENEEEKKKPPAPNPKSQPISKIDLQTILTQDKRNLGTIATNGQALTVDMIKAKLPANIQNEVDIRIIDNTKATLTAKANSNYKGNVEFNYTVDSKVELATVLPQNQRNLGTIATNGQALTVDMIKAKLPANIQNEVDIRIIDNTKATLTAKANSNYKGNVEFNYTVDSKVELATVLPQNQRNLGTIATNGQALTVDMIKAKLPANIQNEVDIRIIDNTKATLTAKANSNYKGNVEFNYTVDSKVELATVLPQNQRNLGTIATNGQALTVDMIKAKLPANIQNEVDIRIIDNTKATLTAKANSNYKGNVEFNYTVDSKVELATVLPQNQRNLGTIVTNGALQPTVAQIQTELSKKGIDISQVNITNISSTQATVKPIQSSSKYKGNPITVIFTVDSKVELATAQSAVWSLATDNNGNIYAGDKNGNVYKNGQIIININSVVREIIIDKNGNIYAGTLNGKIYKINTSQSKWSKTEVHDLKLQVTSLATDNNGNIYAGTYKNGNVYKNGQIIININSVVREIIIDKNGNIYAGTLNGKIYKINTSQSKWSKTEVHDLKLQVTSLATDNNGNIYAGTLNGKIYKINTSQSKWSKTEVHDLKLQVTSLATDNNGNIYAGTLNGKIYKL